MNRHKNQFPIWYLDKIIFAIASVYLALVIIWLASRNRLWIPLISPPQPPPTAQKPAVSPSDAEFIAYLERSLELIDSKQAQIAREQPPATIPIPTTVAPPPPPQQTIIEKVYVPVYPQGQPPAATAPIPQSKPATTPPPPAPVAKSNPHGSAPSKSLTLVGLLEAGDRGYALFDIQGTTRRFEPGEIIGASGWTLMSVQNQQAIVYANGKTRSLDVGQGF